jgi:pyrimidine oxygenase
MQVMKDLWTKGRSNFNGSISPWKIADYCHWLPLTSSLLLRAMCVKRQPTNFSFSTKCFFGQKEFAYTLSRQGVCCQILRPQLYQRSRGESANCFQRSNSTLVEAPKIEDRNVGALVLFMIIADEMDEAAHAKFEQ